MLVKFIDNTANSDFIVVLAGYRNLMTKMLNANLNLMSRMGNWIDFPDYDDSELLQISGLLAKSYGYSYDQESQDTFVNFMSLRKEVRVCLSAPPVLCLSRDYAMQRDRLYILPVTTANPPLSLVPFSPSLIAAAIPQFPYFSNARTVRNAMERARRIAATRILTDALDNGTKYSMDQIQSFRASDFQMMVDEIKALPRDTMLP